ncbi:MAG: tRNA (adenosine(37)-N6)-threonylcarbamoyltransferase complex ATPase subunit type 1 TsaE [Paludibacteraceae bacterium]|nr:tRNA (adenosine(37)-N6)-threonylcarbamoyltransferase complex ATPase subunit type 1 TsaE [Paludibacteraceae bacterium]
MTATTTIQIPTTEALASAADQFISRIGDRRVFAFNGQMGAGKTTLIKAVCERLGVTDTVNSPTFAIVNVYASPRCGEIYHFDCYRLRNTAEAIDFGAEDYLYSGRLCFIEWPDRIAPLLPDDTVNVSISVDQQTGCRTIVME